jgi:uncharacterized membrane protein YedE/YeeE
MRHAALMFGIGFGFVLSRVGATSHDAISGMFMLQDLRLAGVMVIAIGVSALGFALVRKFRLTSLNGAPIELVAKPFNRWLALGSLMFGVGWSLSGACPGTALAQVGEGRLSALATLGGILLASFLVETAARRRTSRRSGMVTT